MDDFAKRWATATEPEERRDISAKDLIRSIHASSRVERLAGNPMLLTTLALVKRKIGKLPQRRIDLYREAVQVLLNWRSEVDPPLEWREAIPQLEYIAYVMCKKGIQRLTRDEVLDLLWEVREKYPNIHTLKNHTPDEFLKILESRTSILIESGNIRKNGFEIPVYEFRHLTFQEYLAALALVEGRFPGHVKGSSLAERVGSLAGIVEKNDDEYVVVENWREPLRLCLAACNDDDVDDALIAILGLKEGEDVAKTTRPRAIMAVLCLADEPNVSENIVDEILESLSKVVDERDGNSPKPRTLLDLAAKELALSSFSKQFRSTLVKEFCSRDSKKRHNHGGLCAMMDTIIAPKEPEELKNYIISLVNKIREMYEELVPLFNLKLEWKQFS